MSEREELAVSVSMRKGMERREVKEYVSLTVQLDFSRFTLGQDDDIAAQIDHGRGVLVKLQFTCGQETASRL